jgi:hypothetical protein
VNWSLNAEKSSNACAIALSIARWPAATVRTHHFPEERMIVVPATVVANRTTEIVRNGVEFAQQSFNGPAGVIGTFQSRIHLAGIPNVVLVVMQTHCLLVNMRLKSRVIIREIRCLKRHVPSFFNA